ncbi:restriction endonuclease subunit S [Enterococcus durans]|uniref:restriction endonuclease subunit S n=1 Tax=Enterococcus durans TaxID=53345 RepID=UPI00163BCA9B|nr:restriction endonuclease subunit S [Enterococcus durans]
MTPEQLKASILQRAMEGKLVPQDPNDEPASELLKRIKAEKEKLIKEGKIKRDKNETEIYRGDDGLHYEKFADGTVKEVEVPFEIPDSWQWCRIDQLALAKGGKRVPKGMKLQEEANSYPYLRVTDMKNETILENKIQYAPPQVREVIKNYTISSEDLYITIAGTIGNAGTIPTQFDGALLTENALKLMIYPLVNKMFLLKAINSPAIQNQFLELFNQVAQPKLSIRSTNSTLIPLPPSTEQKRILARLEGVFEVLPKYEVSYAELTKLNKEFPEKLRKSILQYAMQGKLVPQDPNDERVEVLLEKIRQEKQKLFEEGKLKKKDLQESIIFRGVDNSYYEKLGKIEAKIEVPFDLPNNYVWKRIRDIYYNDGQTKPRNTFKYIDTGTIDNKSHQLLMGNIRKISATQAPSRARKKVSVNSVLFSSVRPYLTNAAIFEEDNPDDYIASTAFVVMNPILVSSQYLLSVLISPFMIEEMNKKSTGSNYPAINDTNFNTLLVPVTSKSVQDQMVTRLFEFDQYISQIG